MPARPAPRALRGPRAPRTVRAARVLTPLLVSGLVLAGCGGGGDEGGQEEPAGDEPTSAAAPQEPATWPLTGLEVEGGGDADQPHPAYVVKIDNTASSAPQRGLHRADLVVEELVEGGTTRLAAFFHTRLPQVVGPVRSMRASDIGIVTPAKATVVTSGAAPVTIRRVQQAGITFIGEGAPGVFRDGARSAPYNLMADLADIGTRARKSAPDPAAYLEWGTPEDVPQGRPARRLEAFFGSHTTTWEFGRGTYRNVGSYAAPDEQFEADTVLVLRVEVGDAGYRDPAGNFVPETKFQGTGAAMLFHGGRMVRGTWSKQGLGAPLTLRTPQGPLRVPAGHTWIELVPRDGGDVRVGR
nr:DUF3048 domain-containing protein [Nocardioides perillae]